MRPPFDRLPPDVAVEAVDLGSFGVRELAWPRACALAVLSHLGAAGWPVLGGDVLASVAPLTYAHANWHCDRRIGEDGAAYLRRSLREAREYIERYPPGPAWFVLVAGEPGTPIPR